MTRSFLLMSSMRYAIRAEKFCRQQSITCEVVPVPRQISSECGMCLEVAPDQAKQVLEQLQQQDSKLPSLKYRAVYLVKHGCPVRV